MTLAADGLQSRDEAARRPGLASSIAQTLFGIDTRALCVLRIALGVLLLVDLVTRAPNLVAHYTDLGVLPRAALEVASPYTLFGGAGWTGLMFALSAVVALSLLVGYQTFLATLLSWFLLISLHMRNVLVDNSGDQLLVLLLFWSLFLPLGARGSVDACLAGGRSRVPRVVVCPGSVALCLQVLSVYMFTAILKSWQVWWVDAQGVYWALNIDYQTTDVGRFVLGQPGLVQFLSRATLALEFGAPLLALVPWRSALFRTATVLALIGFHLSHAICMELSLFPYVCMVAWLPFLPTPVWDRLERLAAALGGRTLAARSRACIARVVGGRVERAALVDSPGMARPAQIVAGVLALYVLVWNVDSVHAGALPKPAQWLGEQLRLGQRWRMFAPSPTRDDGWWIAPATLQDGTEVDLFTGRATARDRPKSLVAMLPTIRWSKYFENLKSEHRNKARYLADWLRRRWDTTHDRSQGVASLDIVYMVELTMPDYNPPMRDERLVYRWKAGG